MAFFGRETVLADLRLHKAQAGLVTAGTLRVRGASDTFTDVAYENVCLWPPREMTGLGGGGAATQGATVTAWRTGEASAPSVDDKWVIGGVSFLIVSRTARHSHDEASGYAIYDCQVSRMV